MKKIFVAIVLSVALTIFGLLGASNASADDGALMEPTPNGDGTYSLSIPGLGDDTVDLMLDADGNIADAAAPDGVLLKVEGNEVKASKTIDGLLVMLKVELEGAVIEEGELTGVRVDRKVRSHGIMTPADNGDDTFSLAVAVPGAGITVDMTLDNDGEIIEATVSGAPDGSISRLRVKGDKIKLVFQRGDDRIKVKVKIGDVLNEDGTLSGVELKTKVKIDDDDEADHEDDEAEADHDDADEDDDDDADDDEDFDADDDDDEDDDDEDNDEDDDDDDDEDDDDED